MGDDMSICAAGGLALILPPLALATVSKPDGPQFRTPG